MLIYVIIPISFFSITICNLIIDFPSYNNLKHKFTFVMSCFKFPYFSVHISICYIQLVQYITR